jgi:hypothetical protein
LNLLPSTSPPPPTTPPTTESSSPTRRWQLPAYGTAIVGTVSGTSISFGTAVVFESANSNYISTTYDSTNNKIVIAYRDDGNSSYGTAIVGTVSGTSISFGTAVVFESASSGYISTTYDSTNNKIVIAYSDSMQLQLRHRRSSALYLVHRSHSAPAVVFESATSVLQLRHLRPHQQQNRHRLPRRRQLLLWHCDRVFPRIHPSPPQSPPKTTSSASLKQLQPVVQPFKSAYPAHTTRTTLD